MNPNRVTPLNIGKLESIKISMANTRINGVRVTMMPIKELASQ
jgi:hypothetical protein